MTATLLVIGNGFDKYCGLKSSFKDYINSDFYSEYRKRVKEIYDIANGNKGFYTPDPFALFGEAVEEMKKVTFWDLYFSIPVIRGFSRIELWYDFEKKMNTFLDRKEYTKEYNILLVAGKAWAKSINERPEEVRYMITLFYYLAIKTNHSNCNQDLSDDKVDKVLFEDLKAYEKRFGEYIRDQQIENKKYTLNALTLLGNIIDVGDEIVYVNTFNYSDLFGVIQKKPVWHINGDAFHPIFGVDFPDVNASSKKFKYTKTYRRMEIDEERHPLCYPQDIEYTKVIVFGHSLNEQDYNYFFALFNRMNFSNERGRNGKCVIEFVFAPHFGKTVGEVRADIVNKASLMIQKYCVEILHEKNYRLLDILHLSGAIKFRGIPSAENLLSNE